MGKQYALIDADLIDNGTRHPNLALMKLSGFLRENGYSVELVTNYENLTYFDKVYISKVFSFTTIPEDIKDYTHVRVGGTGFFSDGGPSLPRIIEHHMPDYGLYSNYIEKQVNLGVKKEKFIDYLNFSIGFTTRGCFRQCEFCVNKRFTEIVLHSPVVEFLDNSRPGIYLWDDNFLGFSGWESILDQLDATNKYFQFRQGLDIRLLTDQKAMRLSKSKYYGDYIFAFDNIEDSALIEKKLALWRQYSKKNTKLFVLCGYKSLDEIDIKNTFARIKILMKYSCVPYVMRYENYINSKYKSIYIQLARWCNQPQFFKKMSFRQYCKANQLYQLSHHSNSKGSSAYYSMIDFEKEFPEIAKEYFDLRFDEMAIQ
ncbi:MAG: hypothetical protein VB013_08275 [Anaerolineaceae bacterium]|nr:hypothetical protein [Anaerolineaceae bacterium]